MSQEKIVCFTREKSSVALCCLQDLLLQNFYSDLISKIKKIENVTFQFIQILYKLTFDDLSITPPNLIQHNGSTRKNENEV